MRAAICAEGLGKSYRLGAARRMRSYRTLRESLAGLAPATWARLRGRGPARSAEPFWALRDVSFEVRPGEALGILGHNGAGKSTLLKVLSRITRPTTGRAAIRGRVGSLLEVGTGFHPELSGRDNIYLNGSILGMARREIARRFDEIVAFAEVERFLDTPVKRYSSGMYVRLAFAVAAHLQPEVLLVDEVLAVGDAAFQRKCLNKMGDVGSQGATVLFVSHNMYAMAKLTRRCLLVEGGRVVADGPTAEVVKRYLAADGDLQAEWRRPGPPPDGRDVFFTAVRSCDPQGRPLAQCNADEPFCIDTFFTVRREVDVQIAFRLNSSADGATVFTSAMPDARQQFAARLTPGDYHARCHVPAHLLVPGPYHLLVAANNPRGPQFDLLEQVLAFEVTKVGSLTGIEGRLGAVAPLLQWEVLPA